MSRTVLVVFSLAMLSCLLYAETGGATSLRFLGNADNGVGRVEISVDPPTPADIGRTDFTIDFWMRASISGNDRGGAASVCDLEGYDWITGNIILDRDRLSSSLTRDFGVSLVSGRLAFGVEPTSGNQYTICSASGTDLRDNVWHHIALQRAISGQLSVYVDGVLHRQANGPIGDLSYPDGDLDTGNSRAPLLVLGAEKYDFGADYVGLIDELRLSTSLRYSANFTVPSAAHTTDGTTAALYHFDDAPGDVIIDQQGQSNGVRRYSTSAGPEWSTDTPPFTATPGLGQISFTPATYSPNENDGVVAVVVRRTGGFSGPATATVSVTGGTATGGADYQIAAPFTVRWLDGESANQTVPITVLDDSDVEPAETVSLTLSNATGAALGSPTAATLTINDNDSPASPGTIQFSGATASVNEGQASIALTLSRTGGSAGEVTVTYATSNGTATADSDYTASSGTVTWADGVATSQTFSIPILNDSVAESSAESFTVTLSNVQGGATLGATAVATVTINDEDAPTPPGNSGGGGGGGGGSTDWNLLAGLLALWLCNAARPRRAGISRRRM